MQTIVPNTFGSSLSHTAIGVATMNPRAIDTSQRPFVLVWELTQACELACKHCRADAKPNRHPDELTTAEGQQLLDEAAQFGDGQLVVLSGGDPLAREDAAELVQYGTDAGLRMTLTPSGTASLTRDSIDELADAGLQRVALSIDGGSAEAHDAFRKENGSFDQTVAAAEAAKSAGLPLQVNTTVCAETVDELPKIRQLVEDLGAVLWSVFFLVPVGRGRVLDPISPARAEGVMEWLSHVADEARFGVKTTEAPHYRRVVAQRGSDSTDRPSADSIGRRAGITAGNGFAFVSHIGKVYPSGFLPQSAGNVREQSVVDIYRNSDLFRSLRDPDALRGKCGACEFRHLCGGSRSRAFAYTQDPLESDPLCDYVPDGYEGQLPEQTFTARDASTAD
ncbi:Fe-S oxidoreductase [Halogeometricum borinquense DSM 11551]|uniref:Fe-S oxidoreductase n=2 Tax=Halogeometricum borinquense (strain ATCC 700274 / DSM 11551 / JCM 10706 / KCTC 4070 / PR3) TaxID=469382 RepID=L9UW92_HALBP|nr:Fe-S oxidoreductase [Halogeometricum borinquense DSM 11551]